MSPTEFHHWILYWIREPFGAWRDNWHMAQLAALYGQVHAKPGASIKPADFMYKTEGQRKDENARAFINALRSAAIKKKEPSSHGQG